MECFCVHLHSWISQSSFLWSAMKNKLCFVWPQSDLKRSFGQLVLVFSIVDAAMQETTLSRCSLGHVGNQSRNRTEAVELCHSGLLLFLCHICSAYNTLKHFFVNIWPLWAENLPNTEPPHACLFVDMWANSCLLPHPAHTGQHYATG